jgi:hypothetical protein
MKLSRLGRQNLARNAGLVEKRWEQIERVVEHLPITAGKLRVYQDGLPVCGHERRIVSELAEAGSRNHRLLLRLESEGAVLMGTECPELLLEELQLHNSALASGISKRAALCQAPRHDALLERRDRFIADRINGTLAPGETGILLLGMLHAADRFLARDIEVVYPLGKGR